MQCASGSYFQADRDGRGGVRKAKGIAHTVCQTEAINQPRKLSIRPPCAHISLVDHPLPGASPSFPLHSRCLRHPFFWNILRSVRVARTRLGWREASNGEDCQIVWCDPAVGPERFMRLSCAQKINHFPGMLEICRKRSLARHLQRMHANLPSEYAFFPTTFFLPESTREFVDSLPATAGKRKRTYIVKPDSGARGKGISLCHDQQSARTAIDHIGNHPAIAQRYLARPLLISGYKFDLRVYVLVTCADPLRIYMYNDCLVRFCSSPYSCPTSSNMHEMRMHLTNYSINKNQPRSDDHGDDDDEKDGDDDGCTAGADKNAEEAETKWTKEKLEKWMTDNGHDFDAVWISIGEIAVKTILSAQPHIVNSYKSIFNVDTSDMSCCFELLGMDIMLDKNLKPWLFEVNCSPSYLAETPQDVKVKESLIKDTLRMVQCSWKLIDRLRREKKEQVITRLLSWQQQQKQRSQPQQATKSQADIDAAHRKQLRAEEARSGNFARVLPSDNEERAARFELSRQTALGTDQETRIAASNSPISLSSAASTTSATSQSGDGISATSASGSRRTNAKSSESAASAEEEKGKRRPAGPPKLSTAERQSARERVLSRTLAPQPSFEQYSFVMEEEERCRRAKWALQNEFLVEDEHMQRFPDPSREHQHTGAEYISPRINTSSSCCNGSRGLSAALTEQTARLRLPAGMMAPVPEQQVSQRQSGADASQLQERHQRSRISSGRSTSMPQRSMSVTQQISHVPRRQTLSDAPKPMKAPLTIRSISST